MMRNTLGLVVIFVLVSCGLVWGCGSDGEGSLGPDEDDTTPSVALDTPDDKEDDKETDGNLGDDTETKPGLDTATDKATDTETDSEVDTGEGETNDTDTDEVNSLGIDGPVYEEVMGVWFKTVTKDGTLIAGEDQNAGVGFLVPTKDVIESPYSRATFEYLGAKTVREITGFADDDNIVLASIDLVVDGSNMDGGAYYDRTTKEWTVLGAPEEGIDFDACRFYPNPAGISADGNLIVGSTATLASACRYSGFVYNVKTDSWIILPTVGPDGPSLKVQGCNEDASVIFGWEQRDAERLDGEGSEIVHYGGRVPVLWTLQKDGTYKAQWLGQEPPGEVLSCSADGKFIAGSDFQHGKVWNSSGVVVNDIGKLEGRAAAPFGISDDGSVVIGSHLNGVGYISPFVAHEDYNDGKMTLINEYFKDAGITDLKNFKGGFVPLAISSDGIVVVGIGSIGMGNRLGWVAVVDYEE